MANQIALLQLAPASGTTGDDLGVCTPPEAASLFLLME
jgi:hypothetical protein